MRFSGRAVAAAAFVALAGAAPAAALSTFSVALDAGQEVPPNGSAATGLGSLVLDGIGPGDFTLGYDIVIDSLIDFGTDVVGMHIHGLAFRGANAGVVFNILGDPDLVLGPAPGGGTRLTGLWDDDDAGDLSLHAAALASTPAGSDTPFYVNLHTVDFPGGEIRGQIVATPLPAALGLLGAGLAGLGLLARRRTA